MPQLHPQPLIKTTILIRLLQSLINLHRPTFRPQFPNFQPPFQPNIPQNFDFNQHQSLHAAAASSAPFTGQFGATAAQWQPDGNHFLQQEAAQAQAMTRKMKLNRLRAEIASVQRWIMAAHSNPA